MTINFTKTHTAEEALAIFESLPDIPCSFMLGRWRGAGFHTNHQMDGLLETFHWYGKDFVDTETVHPLVMGLKAEALYNLDPGRIPFLFGLKLRFLHTPAIARLMQFLRFLVSTNKPKARLRAVTWHGGTTAAMVYDDKPIIDLFKKIDEDTVLGLMDMRGLSRPFYFVLHRD